MARLPIATRESVPEAQRAIFDEMLQGLGLSPATARSVLIHVPKAHRWATGLNHYLRDESSLPKKIQELAMLVTARELDCQHIWNAHAASARQAGVGSAIVDALRDGKTFPALAPDEVAVVQFGREFFGPIGSAAGPFRPPWSSSAARASSSWGSSWGTTASWPCSSTPSTPTCRPIEPNLSCPSRWAGLRAPWRARSTTSSWWAPATPRSVPRCPRASTAPAWSSSSAPRKRRRAATAASRAAPCASPSTGSTTSGRSPTSPRRRSPAPTSGPTRAGQFFDDLFRVTQYRTDPDLVELLVTRSLDTHDSGCAARGRASCRSTAARPARSTAG